MKQFVRAVLIFYAIASGCVFAVALLRLGTGSLSGLQIALFYIAPCVACASLLLSLGLSTSHRAILASTLTAGFIGAYSVEALFHIQQYMKLQADISMVEAKLDKVYDRRTGPQVIYDLRAKGIEAYPAYARKFLDVPLNIAGEEIIPLSGISNSVTVHCNESGKWRIYDSDEFGFANPRAIWGSSNVDIAVIGDSFVHGSCVEKDIPTYIRNHFPRTLNAGYGGAGPLTEYIVFREYVASEKPKVVLWVYVGNDLGNLLVSIRQPVFQAYLENSAGAGLRDKQAVIDGAVRRFMTDQFAAKKAESESVWPQMMDLLFLRKLRQSLRLKSIGKINPERTLENFRKILPVFQDIISRTKREVESWGGKMVFVALPTIRPFDDNAAPRFDEQILPKVLAAVRAAGLPILNLGPVFGSDETPFQTYLYHSRSHYNEKGYELAASAIVEYLERQRLVNGMQRVP